MTRPGLRRLAVACTLWVAISPGIPGPALAATATLIIVPAQTEVVAGDYGEVVAILQVAGGPAIAGERITMTLLGEVRQRRTDATGSTFFRIANTLAIGSYTMVFSFPGTSVYSASQASATLVITKPTVNVQTVPTLEGVPFTLGGETAYSDGTGIARIPFTPPRSLEQPTAGDLELSPRVIARFDRWFGSSASRLTATYSLQYFIRLSFSDLAGNPVDRSLVSGLTIKNSVGERFTLTNERAIWIQGSRVVPLGDGLESKDIYYTVESVTVNGSNVVNRAQQKFIPSEVVDWDIRLLFYSARVSVRDAMLRLPIGSAIRLEYPDGKVVDLPLVNGQLEIPSLPRGEYRISVVGPGLGIPRPLALSRDQDVVLEFVSWLDIGLVAGGGLLALGGLLLLGRPRLRRHFGRWTDPRFALRWAGRGVLIGLTIAGAIVFLPGIVRTYLSIFDAPRAVESPASTSTTEQATPTGSLHIRAGGPTEYEVQPGDTLRTIAVQFYGDEEAWSQIYDTNRSVIPDPDAIEVGTRITLP